MTKLKKLLLTMLQCAWTNGHYDHLQSPPRFEAEGFADHPAAGNMDYPSSDMHHNSGTYDHNSFNQENFYNPPYFPQFEQNHYYPYSQYDHPGESSQAQSHDPASHHPTNAPQAQGYNPYDFPNTPLLPYYFMATLQYPFEGLKQSGKEAMNKLIETALKNSDFNVTPQSPTSTLVILNPSTGQLTSAKSFLATVCTRNIAFLFDLTGLDKKITRDDILAETEVALHWLYELLDVKYPLNTAVTRIQNMVHAHLSAERQRSEVVTFNDARGGKMLAHKVSEYEAKEELVALLVLKYYYQSKNLIKWNLLLQDGTFLQYFIRRTAIQYNKNALSIPKITLKKNDFSLLPWKQNLIDTVDLSLGIFASSSRERMSYLIGPHVSGGSENTRFQELFNAEQQKLHNYVNKINLAPQSSRD